MAQFTALINGVPVARGSYKKGREDLVKLDYPGPIYTVIFGEYLDLPKKQESVDDLRRFNYPPLVDLADALYWQSKGDTSKMTEYLNKVDEVKTRFPKLKKEN